jgi:hypothetical protein
MSSIRAQLPAARGSASPTNATSPCRPPGPSPTPARSRSDVPDAAHRAGLAFRRHRAGRTVDHPGADEWPELRREVLRGGGIGPSRDWDSSSWPGDLYRAGGKAPDLVAVETTIGSADSPPWGDSGNDNTMHRYLERAYQQHRQISGEDKRRPAEDPEEEERPAAARAHTGRRQLLERESRAHSERMSAWIRQVRAARAAAPPRPAIGFYTDRKDVVHPIVASRAGKAYALRRGR